MNIDKHKEILIKELRNKEYRDAFVSEHIDTGIPFQIRALRKQREWKQEELADRAGKQQEQISRLENPNYASFTLTTLKELASVFDVGLIVRFAPISDLVEWELGLTSDSLEAVSFDQDDYFKDRPINAPQEVAMSLLNVIEVQAGDLSITVTEPSVLQFPRRAPIDSQTNAQTNVLRAIHC